jgi:hypothetical protein
MTEEPRPEVVFGMFCFALRHGYTDAELQAAVDVLTRRNQKGRPRSRIYGPLLWGMFALVGVYGRDRFTAAKQLLTLAHKPEDERENQSRALVRRFDECFKEEEELRATRDFYAQSGPGMRVSEFYDCWERSGLPLPQGVKSATDRETELRALASNGSIGAAIGNYIVALDKSIAESTFDSGRR